MILRIVFLAIIGIATANCHKPPVSETSVPMTGSFSIQLVHPDNNVIVSSPNSNVDLTEYTQVTLIEHDKKEVLWINKRIEIDITDVQEATLKWQKPPYVIPIVFISFTQLGGKKWADFTTRNVKRRAAILVDGVPLIAPVIGAPITGGAAQIMGTLTEGEARRIVDRLNELIASGRPM